MAAESVLVVEDDPTLVHAIVRNLAARGYATRSATSVAQALAALERERPSLVVMDVDLPDGSGWDVLRALRESGHGAVPAIVMSALRPNPRLCDELETVGVLEKPFPMDSLLRLVAQYTGRLQPPAHADAGAEGEG